MLNTKIMTVSLSEAADDDVSLYVLKAPSARLGGGIRILDAYAVDEVATGAGTSWTVALHRYTAVGTPAVDGTIAVAIGGTATPWAKGVPKQFTIDDTYAFLDAGKWLVIEKKDDGASSDPTNAYVIIHYQLGN